MKIRSIDSVFMSLMFVVFTVSFIGVMLCEGVEQRPFLLICPASIATFFYLAFRVELGDKLK